MTYEELIDHLAGAHDEDAATIDTYTPYGAMSAHVAHHAPDFNRDAGDDLHAVLGRDHTPLPPQHVAP